MPFLKDNLPLQIIAAVWLLVVLCFILNYAGVDFSFLKPLAMTILRAAAAISDFLY